MRVLIDTNILIGREDPKVIDKNLQELLLLLHDNNSKIMIHPASIEDINNDKDENRKKIILSKLKTYPHLESPPDYTNDHEFIAKIASKSPTCIRITKKIALGASMEGFGNMFICEPELMQGVIYTGETNEGMSAFLEKREPKFK